MSPTRITPMDFLRKILATYGMSALLLLTILLAAKRGNHSRAVNCWFRSQFYGAIALEMAEHIAGWDSDLYTKIYIPYTLIMLAATVGVVVETYRESR